MDHQGKGGPGRTDERPWLTVEPYFGRQSFLLCTLYLPVLYRFTPAEDLKRLNERARSPASGMRPVGHNNTNAASACFARLIADPAVHSKMICF